MAKVKMEKLKLFEAQGQHHIVDQWLQSRIGELDLSDDMLRTAQGHSIPPCKQCGSNMVPSRYNAGEYYCPSCYRKGSKIFYYPRNDTWNVRGDIPSQTPTPATPTSAPLTCKIHGTRLSQSKQNSGQYYCSTCWHSSPRITTTYIPDIDVVEVKKDNNLIYKGPYSSWTGAETGATSAQDIDATQSQNIPDNTDDSGEVIDASATASGIYENGQPEADLVQGRIRIYSEQNRANIPIDDAIMTQGVRSVSSKLKPGIERYVQIQDFMHLAESGDPIAQDIYESPVILDTSHENPQDFVTEVSSEPLYRYTEIGHHGFSPNISQANAISVISRTHKNLILCFPTGAGKTACAEAAIAKGLLYGKTPETAGQISIQNPVAVYVCPARALAAQIAKDFSTPDHPFAQAGWAVRIERGVRQIDSPTEDVSPDDEDTDVGAADDPQLQSLAATENASIVVATPERLLTCLMNQTAHPWISRISTMIFDEGHLLGDESRGAKFEGEQIHLYRDYYRRIKSTPIGAQASIIFMSATMQNALELSAWQSNTTEDPNWAVVWGEYKPVPIVQEFEDYEMAQGGEEDFALDMLRNIISQKNYCMRQQADGSTSQVMRPTLVFFHVKRRAYDLQRAAEKFFRECNNSDCGYIFEAPRDFRNQTIPARDEHCPVCGSDVSEWIIDFHHAKVPSGQQQRFVNDFNSGRRKVLVATSTLAAGVNTGAMSVYIGGCARGGRDVSPSDIGQMRGRAGRQSYARDYPDQPARVVIYTEKDRSAYHRRRIQAGAYLESMMADPIYIVDNILRAVAMGSIKNFNDVGRYLASSLAYFQSAVDNRHQMNVRQALKEISRSVDGSNNDRVIWINVKDPDCQHGNIKIDPKSMRDSIEATESDQTLFDWHIICQDCGSEGLMQQEFTSLKDQDFVEMADSALRDLIGSGFLVILPDGRLQITNLGKDIVRTHTESATAVDIVRNMVGFDPMTANAMDVAIAIGNTRENNDERRGCYISKEQATACDPELLTRLGLTPESAMPALKNIQCLLWSLRGVTFDQVPDCLKSDFRGVVDDYGGTFLLGFSLLSEYAGWFEGAGDMLEQIKVQLRNQVSPTQVPFAVVEGIGAVTASALERAGFVSLHDILDSSNNDIRWADFLFYRWKWDRNPAKMLPSTNPRAIDNFVRRRMEAEAGKLKNLARMALDGKTNNGRMDNEYRRAVRLLNSFEFLDKFAAMVGKTITALDNLLHLEKTGQYQLVDQYLKDF